MATEGQRIQGLHEFFAESFTTSELKMFLTLKGYEEVVSAVDPVVGSTEYFFEVIRALDRRGLIDERFFDRLMQERPEKEARIQSLWEPWLVEGKKSPQSSNTETSSDPREVERARPTALRRRKSVPPRPRISHDDERSLHPTVGIITALPHETSAIRAVLGAPPPVRIAGPGAGKSYWMAEIQSANGGTHRVVVAQAVIMGNNSAAIRASQLLEHYPDVESIIMCGIAGGIPHPSKPGDHVRLGDIVVSNQRGVVQYDFVKRTIKGKANHVVEEDRAAPRPPSAELLESVQTLVSNAHLGDRPWEKWLADGLDRLKWKRPESPDVLLGPSGPVEHPRDPDRTAGQPRVFLGPIASANTLLKDPVKRDVLRDKFGVKAVEMEGSGIADATWNRGIGYLVVRGVCDYCDSAKSDVWQNYAAMTAAAYVRALLELLSPVASARPLVPPVAPRPPRTGGEHSRPIPRSSIPEPPSIDVVHPYILMGRTPLVGREDELRSLKKWASDPEGSRVHMLVAIGGMGKSALTWKWFTDRAHREMNPLAGRLWWSFYEDPRFESFVNRGLAYVSRKSPDKIRLDRRPQREREQELFDCLSNRPFLIVLDGLERILNAYPQLDPTQLDEDELDERTANTVPWARRGTDGSWASSPERHRLRQTIEVCAGEFLQRLTYPGLRSRVLVSTRLCPAELDQKAGCSVEALLGLNDEDAFDLWRKLGIRGSRDDLLKLLRSVYEWDRNYPLLIKLLAGVIEEYRPAPGDFDRWRVDHSEDAVRLAQELEPVNKRRHVLEIALRGLTDAMRVVLHTIAFFRMPAAYAGLKGILVGIGKLLAAEQNLIDILRELEDRALIGWDRGRGANCYDIHPVVRQELRKRLDDGERKRICGPIYEYFMNEPMPELKAVKTVEDLAVAIERYRSLVALDRHEDAWREYKENLLEALAYRLTASRHQVELLEMLALPGGATSPSISRNSDRFRWLDLMGHALHVSGKIGRALTWYQCADDLPAEEMVVEDRLRFLGHFAVALWHSGDLRKAEDVSGRAFELADDVRDRSPIWRALGLRYLGQVRSLRGEVDAAKENLEEALKLLTELEEFQAAGATNTFLAELAIRRGDIVAAESYMDEAWRLAQLKNYERDFVHILSLRGLNAIQGGNLDFAEELFGECIARARQATFLEREIPALIGLAEIKRRRGNLEGARDRIQDVWELVRSAPYRLFHADSCIVLAHIHQDEGNLDSAITVAKEAFQLAWCITGPPYAYHWGLVATRRHLAVLGVPEPHIESR
jgi:nucleoside phosphorylase/tetratricopeptide (TPR) repeat protein